MRHEAEEWLAGTVTPFTGSGALIMPPQLDLAPRIGNLAAHLCGR
jgi:hypothetical protein